VGGNKAAMTSCIHQRCGREQYVWYPENTSKYAQVVKHPYCIHCGLFENISEHKAKHLGFWVNIVALLAEQYALSQVQRRLITQTLKNHAEFNDIYGLHFSSQQQFFIQTVQQFTKWSVDKIQRCIK
jgi:hypothetical protein